MLAQLLGAFLSVFGFESASERKKKMKLLSCGFHRIFSQSKEPVWFLHH